MSPQQEAWIGLDPGRCKCGLVRSDAAGEWIADLLICNPRECWDWLQHWISLEPLQGVVIGDGTTGHDWHRALNELPVSVPLILQSEHGSTLAARRRYWELFPPRGWRRLLPEGLRIPPRPVDDVAALVLLEAHLGRSLQLVAAQKEALTVNM